MEKKLIVIEVLPDGNLKMMYSNNIKKNDVAEMIKIVLSNMESDNMDSSTFTTTPQSNN